MLPGPVDRPVGELRPHEGNPRRISRQRLDDLKRSLEHDRAMLQVRPLIALPDGRVIAGNQRLVAAQELGWETVPVAVVNLDEATARLWMLRDNSSYGEWDDPMLAEMLAELDEQTREFSGLDADRIEDLLIRQRPAADPDDVPPVPTTPRSELGEVYELGPHRLMCGDASDPAQVAALVRGGGVLGHGH